MLALKKITQCLVPRGVNMARPLTRFATTTTTTLPIKIFFSTTFDPWFNLATEEWLYNGGQAKDGTLTTTNCHVLYLWRNDPVIVIGKHQNPWKECRVEEMEKRNVKLARRPTGGGAVYQDRGNTCFTFISPTALADTARNNNIIINALKDKYNIVAEASGRNDMVSDSKKFSGAAFKKSANVNMHHGTLLINVDMSALGKLLNPSLAKLQSKGVSSVTARVTNLVDVNKAVSHEGLCDALISSFKHTYNGDCDVSVRDDGDDGTGEASQCR